MSPYARFLWLGYGLLEDIKALADIYSSSPNEETRLVLARHVLIDFDSLNTLLREFQRYIKQDELSKLNSQHAAQMHSAFVSYNRAVQPSRKSLREIRNNFGTHRTGESQLHAPQSGVTSREEWGKWELYLTDLEQRCELNQWLPSINAAVELLNLLKDFNLDAWYSGPEDGNIRFFLPLLPPGYYP
jgi:hypothetical protein